MVFECGLGPQCLAWHTWRCPCIRGQKCVVRLRAPEGCSVSSNIPPGSEPTTNQVAGRKQRVNNILPDELSFRNTFQKPSRWVSSQTWSAAEVAMGGSGCAVAKCWIYCAPSAPVVTTCWPICWRGWKSRNVSLFYWSHLTKGIGNFKQNTVNDRFSGKNGHSFLSSKAVVSSKPVNKTSQFAPKMVTPLWAIV